MRQVLKLKKKTEKEKQKLAMQSISFKDWIVCQHVRELYKFQIQFVTYKRSVHLQRDVKQLLSVNSQGLR